MAVGVEYIREVLRQSTAHNLDLNQGDIILWQTDCNGFYVKSSNHQLR